METLEIIVVTTIMIGVYVGIGFIGYYLGKKHKPKDEKEQTIEELFTELRELIINEDYEHAAIIRDKLRKLTK